MKLFLLLILILMVQEGLTDSGQGKIWIKVKNPPLFTISIDGLNIYWEKWSVGGRWMEQDADLPTIIITDNGSPSQPRPYKIEIGNVKDLELKEGANTYVLETGYKLIRAADNIEIIPPVYSTSGPVTSASLGGLGETITYKLCCYINSDWNDKASPDYKVPNDDWGLVIRIFPAL